MAKRSRRTRRQEIQKQANSVVSVQPTIEEVAVAPKVPAPVPRKIEAAAAANRNDVNFVQEYAHVYYDVRNVVIISGIMFVALIALSIAI